MKKFEIGKSKDIDKFNEWFTLCKNEQIPFIRIIEKTKYSTIDWDHINLDPKLDKIFVANREVHIEQLLNVFKKYANKYSNYTMSNLFFNAEKIEREKARSLAEDLFDIIKARISN